MVSSAGLGVNVNWYNVLPRLFVMHSILFELFENESADTLYYF